MNRTREQEIRDALVESTIEDVKVRDTAGGSLVTLRLSRPGSEEDAFVCFDERGFADAHSIWHHQVAS